MSKLAWLLCVICFCFSAKINAQEQGDKNSEDVQNVVAGLVSYKNSNIPDAVKNWLMNSPFDGTQEEAAQVATLQHARHAFGPLHHYEFLSKNAVSGSVHILYAVFAHAHGPLFAKFVLFRSEQGWIVSSFAFSTKDTDILPIVVPTVPPQGQE